MKKFSHYKGHDKSDKGFYCCLVCGHYYVNVSEGEGDVKLECARCHETGNGSDVAEQEDLCPSCGREFQSAGPFVNRFNVVVEGVNVCADCGAVIGKIERHNRGKVVENKMADYDCPGEFQRFYSLTLTHADGETYVHGWFDVRNGMITQIG